MLKKIIGPVDNLAKIFVFFIFFSYLMMFVFYNLGGLDYLFHIKAGEYIVENKIVPDKDIFSFTMAGKSWFDHEWLYQVLVYTAYSIKGLEALFLLKVFIFSLSFFILTLFVFKIDWVFSFPLLFYGLQIAIRRFTLRPDNFSFLFLILFLFPLVFKKRRLLYPLPFIQVLWANMHGFFFLGPLVLFLYVFLGYGDKSKEAYDFRKTALKTAIFSLAACLITPHLFSGIIYPFAILREIFTGSNRIFYENIQELQSPLTAYRGRIFFMSYLVMSAICLMFRRRLNLFYLGLYIVFAAFSLNSLRNVYFFVPIGVVIFADRYNYIKKFFIKNIVRKKGFILLKVFFFVFSLSLSFSLIVNLRAKPGQIKSYLIENNKIESKSDFLSQANSITPRKLIEFIGTAKLPSSMFNTFNLGAPLIYNFFPERKVFIDGRTELYGKDFFSDYLKIVDGDQDAFEKLIDRYNVEGFIISYLRESPVFLIRNAYKGGFKCVYFAKDGIVFVDKDFFDKTPSLRAKAVDFASLEGDDIDLLATIKDNQVHMEGHFNMGYVLYLLGYHQQSKGYLQGVLKVVPDHALSYYYLADIYYQEGNYEKAFLYCRNGLSFAKSSARVRKLMAKIFYKTGYQESARDIVQSYGINFSEFVKEVESE
jgi:tetratricopeptide (TPR) repeat protein